MLPKRLVMGCDPVEVPAFGYQRVQGCGWEAGNAVGLEGKDIGGKAATGEYRSQAAGVGRGMKEQPWSEATEACPFEFAAQLDLPAAGGVRSGGDEDGPIAAPEGFGRGVDASAGLLDALPTGLGEGVSAGASFALRLQPALCGEAEAAGSDELRVNPERLQEGGEVAEQDAGEMRQEKVPEEGDDEGLGTRGFSFELAADPGVEAGRWAWHGRYVLHATRDAGGGEGRTTMAKCYRIEG